MSGHDKESRDISRVFAARDRKQRPKWVTEGYRILTAERRALTVGLVKRHLPHFGKASLVDVGCGGGLDIEWWRREGWPTDRLAGIDLNEERVAAARARNPGVDLRLGTGPILPFAEGAFDVATASTVFSSIPSVDSRRTLFGEMSRIVRPGGLLIVYDFVIRNPRNPDVVAMTRARLTELAGHAPDASVPVSPFLPAVGPAAILHPALGRAVARIAPRTHLLSFWRA
ncbi:MAG: class I SAM-dependent methyltransferase [Chloroflexota bacterium]